VIGNSRFHRRRATQRLVNPAKIVERKPHGKSSPVVLPLFTEAISKPREAANAHPRAKVAALDNRSADTLWIGLPHDWDSLHGSHFGGTVAASPSLAVDLDELHEASESIMNVVVIAERYGVKPSVVI
jgi:hypothetical protein